MSLTDFSLQFNETLLNYILIGFFGAAVLIQLIYFLFIFSRLIRFKPGQNDSFKPAVSVIICARNEIKNLRNHLEKVLEQNYPVFQVVVVNDCSWDETELYLEVLESRYDNLKVVTIKEQERYRHGKKFALALGIKAAQYDYLLMTDADCIPASENWIGEIMQAYTEEKEIVLGYGAYQKQPTFINKWIRFETAFNSMMFLNFALGRNAYMGVGRNLSYKRQLFFESKGFASHQHLLSGDDDLFVNENASKKNVAICVKPGAFTFSIPKSSWSEWFNQKKRHLSTSLMYRAKHKFALGLFHSSQIIFWLISIVLLVLQIQLPLIVSVFVFRLLIVYIVLAINFKKLDELDVSWLAPFFEIFMIFLYPVVMMASRLHNDRTWK